MFKVACTSWVRLASLLLAQRLNYFDYLNKELEGAPNLGGSTAVEGSVGPIPIGPSVRAPFFSTIVFRLS